MSERGKKTKTPEPIKIKIPDPSKIGREHPIDAATAKLVAGSEKLSTITTLDLTDSPVGPEGLAALLASPHLKKIMHLHLNNARLGDAGCKLLVGVSALRGVTEVHLAKNQISAEGLRALLNTEFATHLTALHLDENPLHEEGAEVLAAAHLPNLRTLTLMWCQLGPNGAKALAQASWAKKLKKLLLGNNPLGPEGAAWLSKGSFTDLGVLSLGWSGLGDAGASALAGAKWGEELTHLDLRANEIGEAGAMALSQVTLYKKLKLLPLRHNPVGSKAEKALLRAFPGVRLQLALSAPSVIALCPYCRSKTDESKPRCGVCQQDISHEAGFDATAESYKAQRRVTCHHCGAQRFEDSALCPTCKRWGLPL